MNSTNQSVSPSIFKAYDIRGIVDTTLTESTVRLVGFALGARAKAKGIKEVVVGRDGRLSGPRLIAALSQGFCEAGVDVVDIGMVPTPVVYFATYHLGCGTGVAVTGSHNPPEYNGLKMMLDGDTLYGDAIQGLYQDIIGGKLVKAARPGKIRQLDLAEIYLARGSSDIKLARPMKVVVDAGNGVAGVLGPALLRRVGCQVEELFCEIDGNFPNHHPDPAHVENLQDLIRRVKDSDAELGLAFDGDGDRLGVVTKDGQIIFPDRQMMLFAEDVLSRNPGAQILFDVKCSRLLARHITKHGGRPLMWKTGHSLVKAKLRETGAPLGGEMSGHVFFKERWYGFDDGLYTAVRLLEILSRVKDPSALLNALPNAISTPELQMQTAEGENFAILEALKKKIATPAGAQATFPGASELILIDGVRVEYADGFGLARPSNTTPVVVMRFEGDTQEAIAKVQKAFREAILSVSPASKLPF
jgi:phosphomannomutase / phosphoglucomutase